jgi:predicted dienelactone hydrolase
MAVGFRSGLFLDATRTDWDGANSRPISWAAWYPAPSEVTEAPMRVGGRDEPWFDIGPVARDAPVKATVQGWPVVLLSHGTGGTAVSLGWLARLLAQDGFVVLAANHHGNTAIEPYRAEGFVCWWERARDLSVLLDRMANAGPFADCLDVGRVFAVGFSLGCHTALALLGGLTDMERFRRWADEIGGPLARGPREFPDLADSFPALLQTSRPLQQSWDRRAISYCDARVKAALLLAPAPPVRAFTDESLAAIEAPAHMLVGDADVEAPAEHGADWLAPRLSRATTERVPHAGHFVFLPESTEAGRRVAPALCVDPPGVDRQAIHAVTLTAARRLFG